MAKETLDFLSLSEVFFNNYHTGVAILDRDFNFIRVNELYAISDDRLVSDFPGHNHFEFYPDEDGKEIFETVVRTKQKYQIFGYPFTYRNKPDKGIMYLDGTLVPVLDAKGDVEILILILADVTKQKRKEIELEQFFQHSNDLLCIIDYNFIIRRVNKAFTRILGYSEDELLGKMATDYVHPEDIFTLEKEFESLINNNVPIDTYINRFRCKDGSYKWIEWNNIPVTYERVFYSVGRDITRRKEEEQKQELESYRIKLLLDSLPELVYLQAPNFAIIYANRKFKEVLGDVQGRSCYQIFFDRDKPCEKCLTQKVFQDSVAMYWECTFANGRNYIIYANPFVDIDGSAVTVKIGVDVTERKKSELEMARLDRLNLVGQMAAGIGHEVRNPLTTVRGFLQMLSEKQDCLKYKSYYKLMIEELDRANSIINEFLSLARNTPSELKKQDLNQIIQDLYPL